MTRAAFGAVRGVVALVLGVAGAARVDPAASAAPPRLPAGDAVVTVARA